MDRIDYRFGDHFYRSRVGGTFLAMAGGIGMFIMTFILHVTPSDPPITVILIMIAVICAAATMQACGGLDYIVLHSGET